MTVTVEHEYFTLPSLEMEGVSFFLLVSSDTRKQIMNVVDSF